MSDETFNPEVDALHHISARQAGPMYLYTAQGASVNMDGWYAGRSCFLLGSGPSLKESRLELLDGPGIMTWGMNNSWCVKRPNLWTCVDPSWKFHDRGWRDPRIIKIVPARNAGERLRFRAEDGKHRRSRFEVRDMPGVLFFRRNGNFAPADFLCEPTVCWGMPDGATDEIGCTGIRSVMLATVRLAYYLGFRTLYLLGCDFHMEAGQPYAFEEERTAGVIRHNNRLYDVLNRRFEALAPYFEQAGLSVFNCTPGSGLKVFPRMALTDAVKKAGADCAAAMDDTAGWYHDTPTPKPPPPAAAPADEELVAHA